MKKYEIMMVVDGQLSETEANAVSTKMKAILKDSKKFEETKKGLLKLAYEINKRKQGYYFVYNFESNVPAILKEFTRVALISKEILRHIIINLELDYGYKAINNAKKVAASKKKEVAYIERKKNQEKEWEVRKAAYEASKQTQDEGRKDE